MTPIYILSGQSNAVALNNIDTFRQRILATEPDAIIVEYAVGATTIQPKPYAVDWYAGNDGDTATGELFAVLVTQIKTALEKNPDAYIAGMGWIQGEHDAIYSHGLEYAQNLGLFQDRLTEIFGEFPMAVMALSENAPMATHPSLGSGWQQVHSAQIKAADGRESLILLDPDDIALEAGIDPTRMFGDYVHYSGPTLKALGNAMADRLLAIDEANGADEPTQVNVDQIELIYRTVNGTTAANKMTGVVGHDKMSGLAGNDTIDSGDGHDRIYGNEGNDVLTGGNGNDLLSGGTGGDTFVFNANSGQDVIEDFDLARDVLTFGDVSSIADFSRSFDARGNVVISWDYNGETQSLKLMGLWKTDIDYIDYVFSG